MRLPFPRMPLLRGLLLLAFASLTIAAAAGLALAWRLSQGPLEIDWAAQRIAAYVNGNAAKPELAIGGASLAWTGFEGGASRELVLHVHDVTLHDTAGHDAASVRSTDVNVSLARLLLGQVVLRDVAADGLVLHLVRGPDGAIGLGLAQPSGAAPPGSGPSASLADRMRQLARAPGHQPSLASGGLQRLEELRRVRLTGTVITLDDPRLGGEAQATIPQLNLVRQTQGGMRGGADALLALGGAQARVAVQAQLAPGGGTAVQMQLAPLDATDATAAAKQAGLQASGRLAPQLEASVQGRATLTLTPGLRPSAATVHVQVGAGQLLLAGAPIVFDRVLLDAEASWSAPGWVAPSALKVTQALVTLHAPGGPAPSTVSAQMQARTTGGQIAVTFAVAVDQMAFADLQKYWPERLGGHTRPWLTENLTGGTARNGRLEGALIVAPGFSSVTLTRLNGSLIGDDATIHWLRPVPPVEHAQALLTITEPDTLDIAVSSGRQGDIRLSNGTLHFTGMIHKDQFLALGLDIDGAVTDVVTLLKNPRLQLLSRKPIPMKNPSGQASGHLDITLPMKHELKFEDVGIAAKTHLVNLHLGGLVAGHDLDQGDVTLSASQQSLHAAGRAQVAGFPAAITVDMDFRNGPPSQVVQAASARGQATLSQLKAAGMDLGGVITAGSAQFTAIYQQHRDLSEDVKASADLQGAGLAVAGWTKAPGPPASASATLMLQHDKLQSIEALRASGPGLDVSGRAEMVDGQARRLVLDHIVLGPTHAHGRILFPATAGGPIQATLDGTVLDLSTQLSGQSGATSGAPSAGTPGSGQGRSFIADIRFDRVILAHNEALHGVSGHVESDAGRIVALQLRSTGPEEVRASIRRGGPGRLLALDATDGGLLMRALGVVEVVRGGRLHVAGQFDDRRADSPLQGTMTMAAFQVDKLAVLGKLLQAVTVYGVADALTGRGVLFTNLVLPFRWADQVLDVGPARAFSASLGLTAKGRIDTRANSIDLQGTLVPAYALNSLLGRIPLLGRLFSAERGGGLVAVDYSVRGPLANPSVSVNPLSALTPGFLRGLFHITG